MMPVFETENDREQIYQIATASDPLKEIEDSNKERFLHVIRKSLILKKPKSTNCNNPTRDLHPNLKPSNFR